MVEVMAPEEEKISHAFFRASSQGGDTMSVRSSVIHYP